MPTDKPRFGALDALAEKSYRDVKTIIAGFATTPPAAGSNVAKAADFYASWMDEATLETRGVEPLKPYIDTINGITDKAGLLKVLATPGYAVWISPRMDSHGSRNRVGHAVERGADGGFKSRRHGLSRSGGAPMA